MVDMFKPAERSRIMAGIRSNGNHSTELRFITMMRKYKIIGWRRYSDLPGRPDFVFKTRKIAVFVDGDFWHGNPKKFRLPKSNCDYWEKKILRNIQRDKEVTRQLRTLGWRVVRIWESSLKDEGAIRSKLRLLI